MQGSGRHHSRDAAPIEKSELHERTHQTFWCKMSKRSKTYSGKIRAVSTRRCRFGYSYYVKEKV